MQLSNNGINIKGSAGASVHSVFAGEVSAVFGFSGTTVVMVRHGAYISVYCNLATVNVSKGQKVGARQTLGTVGRDGILQFQLRRETAKLNPARTIERVRTTATEEIKALCCQSVVCMFQWHFLSH